MRMHDSAFFALCVMAAAIGFAGSFLLAAVILAFLDLRPEYGVVAALLSSAAGLVAAPFFLRRARSAQSRAYVKRAKARRGRDEEPVEENWREELISTLTTEHVSQPEHRSWARAFFPLLAIVGVYAAGCLVHFFLRAGPAAMDRPHLPRADPSFRASRGWTILLRRFNPPWLSRLKQDRYPPAGNCCEWQRRLCRPTERSSNPERTAAADGGPSRTPADRHHAAQVQDRGRMAGALRLAEGMIGSLTAAINTSKARRSGKEAGQCYTPSTRQGWSTAEFGQRSA